MMKVSANNQSPSRSSSSAGAVARETSSAVGSSSASSSTDEKGNAENTAPGHLQPRIEALEKQLQEAVAKREKGQAHIKACQNELNRLFRDCPDRPRETIPEIEKRMAKLERERETTSMSLQEEKQILIHLHKLGKAKNQVTSYEQCDEQIKKSKARLSQQRDDLRELNTAITQQRVELSTVRVANQLGCRVQDLLGKKVSCPTSKLGQVIGKKGRNVQQLAGQANVTVNVNKSSNNNNNNNSGKSESSSSNEETALHIIGARASLDKAALDLDRVISTTEEKVPVTVDSLQYWTAKGIHLLTEIRSSHPDVYFDVSRQQQQGKKQPPPKANTSSKTDAQSPVVVLRGIPADIASAKQDLLESTASLETHELHVSDREGSLVVGKQGSTIETLVASHQTVINVERRRVSGSSSSSASAASTSDDEPEETASGSNGTGTTIQIMGPSGHVQSAVREIQNLLQANREMEQTVQIDHNVKSTFLIRGGKGIQALFQKVNDALRDENAGIVHVNLGNAATNPDSIVVKGKARVLEQAIEMVEAEVRRLEHLIVRIPVDAMVIPVLIGRGGRALKELLVRGQDESHQERRLVNVEFAREAGEVHVCGLNQEDVQAVVEEIRAVIASHVVERISLEPDQFKRQIRELLGTKSKEINALVHMKVEDDKFQIMLRGEEEKLAQAATIIREFVAKSYVQEIPVSVADLEVLLSGGQKSKIVELSKETSTTLSTNRDDITNPVVVVKGEKDLVEKAVETVRTFLFGGQNGQTLCKLWVESDEMAAVIGKGGKTKAGLQEKFQQVSISMHRHEDVISLRGPEANVQACRKEILKLVATSWTTHTLDVELDQAEMLAKTRFHRRIMQSVPVKIFPKDSVVTIRGTKEDVRHATALLLERMGQGFDVGYYLESSLYHKIKESWQRDPSHIPRMEKASGGAKIKLNDSQSAVCFSAKKRAAVIKAKLEVLQFWDFALGSSFARQDLPGPLLTSLGQSADGIAEIAAASGATVLLDRDVNAILLLASDSSKVDLAKKLLLERIDNEEKLIYVVQLEDSEDWIVSSILGKNGNRIKALRKQLPQCKIEVVSADRRITVSAETPDAVDQGRSAVDELIAQARKEHVLVDVPSSDMAAFVGRSGAHINEFAAKHAIDVQILKRGKSQVRLTGKDPAAIEAARQELLEWIANRSEKRREEQATETLTVKRDEIPRVIGPKGSVIRGLQRQFGCKVDVDRPTCLVTVQGTRRTEVIQKIIQLLRQQEEEQQGGDNNNNNQVVEAAKQETTAPETRQATQEDHPRVENSSEEETASKKPVTRVNKKKDQGKYLDSNTNNNTNKTETVQQGQSPPSPSDFPSLSEKTDPQKSVVTTTITTSSNSPTWAARLGKDTELESPAQTTFVSLVSDEDWDACTDSVAAASASPEEGATTNDNDAVEEQQLLEEASSS